MNSKTRIVSATLGIAAAVAIVLGAAPAQARFFAGFGFGYPFYRPFPVFYRPYLPPPPLPVYVVPQPAYYAPPPVAYSETETYYTRRPFHRHRRTVSHRVRTCK